MSDIGMMLDGMSKEERDDYHERQLSKGYVIQIDKRGELTYEGVLLSLCNLDNARKQINGSGGVFAKDVFALCAGDEAKSMQDNGGVWDYKDILKRVNTNLNKAVNSLIHAGVMDEDWKKKRKAVAKPFQSCIRALEMGGMVGAKTLAELGSCHACEKYATRLAEDKARFDAKNAAIVDYMQQGMSLQEATDKAERDAKAKAVPDPKDKDTNKSVDNDVSEFVATFSAIGSELEQAIALAKEHNDESYIHDVQNWVRRTKVSLENLLLAADDKFKSDLSLKVEEIFKALKVA